MWVSAPFLNETTQEQSVLNWKLTRHRGVWAKRHKPKMYVSGQTNNKTRFCFRRNWNNRQTSQQKRKQQQQQKTNTGNLCFTSDFKRTSELFCLHAKHPCFRWFFVFAPLVKRHYSVFFRFSRNSDKLHVLDQRMRITFYLTCNYMQVLPTI